MTILLAAALATNCIAVDGDTLRCRVDGAQTSIRLLAIDAPELPGHCRKGRVCAPGDPWRAKRVLQNAVRGQTVQIRPAGKDRWGRTLATASTGRVGDLSCHMLRQDAAIYVRRWDNARRVRTACPREIWK